ncbi:MAG: glycosyltransferase [Desulfobacteraceae bacterium]|nr:glycosyltransferase [Desulfobacteraceae bacterium]
MQHKRSPLISIITPSLNSADFIAEALESVLSQDYPNFEHIVVDGGSEDGTLGILRNHPHLKVIAEPDKNLYDALNKGIFACGGEIIGHLNSDDCYEKGIFEAVARTFLAAPDLDVVSGGAAVFETTATGARRTVLEYARPNCLELSFEYIMFEVPIINARFFRRQVFEKIGMFDDRYRIAADREFLLRMVLRRYKTTSLDRVVYYYRQHPKSLTIHSGYDFESKKKRILEHLSIAESYLKSSTPTGAEHYFRRWHTHESLRILALQLREWEIKGMITAARRGWLYDSLWPCKFLNALSQSFLKEFSKKRQNQRGNLGRA